MLILSGISMPLSSHQWLIDPNHQEDTEISGLYKEEFSTLPEQTPAFHRQVITTFTVRSLLTEKTPGTPRARMYAWSLSV
jgi:hypothetical protein